MAIKFHFLALLLCLGVSTASATVYCLNYIFSLRNIQTTPALANQLAIEQAKSIVVRIKDKKTSGSGILIEKSTDIYTIITNHHVVDHENKYQIQTPDNNIYKGILVAVSQEDDLAILQFTSNRSYATATVNTAPLKAHESLFAAGFPYNSDRLQVTSGKLSLRATKPLKQGYQLGYTNIIQNGMSGGAIFNSRGEVVGINGRSTNPIVPDYQYQDKTYPSEHLQQQMMQLSWGIPIGKAVDLIK